MEGDVFRTHEKVRNAYKILVVKLKEETLIIRNRRRWRIVIRSIVRKQGVRKWTGCNWLRIGTSG
jgi:hypothetical protein